MSSPLPPVLAEGTGRPFADVPGDRPRPALSARAHLFILASGLLFPVLVFAGVLTGLYVDAQRAHALERTRLLARQLVLALERELSPKAAILQVLARSRQLESGDVKGFGARAPELAASFGLHFVLRTPGMARQLINTEAELEDAPPEVVIFDDEVVRTRQPVFTDLVRLSGRKDFGVALMVPVLRDSAVAYVLCTYIPATHIARVLGGVQRDPGWFALVLDRNDIAITRLPEHDRFVGRLAPSRFSSRSQVPEGTWSGINPQGTPVFASYVRSTTTKWAVGSSVPQAVLNEPLYRTTWSLAALGILLLSLAIGLAYWTGSRLSRAVWRLSEAGVAVASGKLVEDIRTPVREANEVAHALARAAQAAIDREAHLKSILDAVPSGMVVIDEGGAIRSFSSTAEAIFGYAAAEVISRDVSLLMPASSGSVRGDAAGQVLSAGAELGVGKAHHSTGVRKNGQTFPMELTLAQAEASGQKLLTAFIRDLSEQQRIDQELRQVQKMEALGKLTGGVAHDFNNLLTVIKGNLEMLESRLAKRDKPLLTDAQEAADIAAELTASLLAFGRRMPLDPKLVDVAQLVSATADLLRRTLGETITVRAVIESSSKAIIDSGQFQNALLNLAINARDAMPNGGTLTVTVAEKHLGPGDVASRSGLPPGPYVLISVTDTGTGMPQEVKERALEPFFTTKPTGAGTGLGLSSVYGFVKQSGGHMTIESELGKGTTICIYLPREDRDGRDLPASEPDMIDTAPLQGRGETVLMVEDDARVRRITASRLTSLGYQVLEARSGPAALKVLSENHHVDLLFTDMVMPGGMSGAQLACEARRTRPQLPILFTSGYAELDSLRQAGGESANWLRKPYTVALLASKLRRILDAELPDGALADDDADAGRSSS